MTFFFLLTLFELLVLFALVLKRPCCWPIIAYVRVWSVDERLVVLYASNSNDHSVLSCFLFLSLLLVMIFIWQSIILRCEWVRLRIILVVFRCEWVRLRIIIVTHNLEFGFVCYLDQPWVLLLKLINSFSTAVTTILIMLLIMVKF